MPSKILFAYPVQILPSLKLILFATSIERNYSNLSLMYTDGIRTKIKDKTPMCGKLQIDII
jgi:hypothetical protein